MIKEIAGQLEHPYARSQDGEKIGADYTAKSIAKLLMEKDPKGKATFYFRRKKDYIVLLPSGQLNVRGEEDLFKAWVSSEFKDVQPQAVFSELKKEIEEISFINPSTKDGYSFKSYREFMNWLTNKSSKKQHQLEEIWIVDK